MNENKLSIKSKRENMDFPQLITNFCEETTLHGVNKIGSKKTICYKFPWALFLMIMLILTTYFISKSITEFFTYKTVANIEIVQNTELEFPAVSICNLGEYSRRRTMEYFQTNGGEMNENFALLNSLLLNQNISFTDDFINFLKQVNLVEYAENTGQPIAHLIHFCQNPQNGYESFDYDCYKNFTSYFFGGFCYTYNSKACNDTRRQIEIDQEGYHNGVKMLINTNQDDIYLHGGVYGSYGIQLSIHDPCSYPNMDTDGIILEPGKEYSIGITKVIKKRLGKPYAKESCIRKEDDPSYNKNLCLIRCKMNIYYNCNCSYWSRGEDGCNLYDSAFCAVANMRSFTSADLRRCNCLPNCEETVYEATVTGAPFHKNLLLESQLIQPALDNYTYFKENYLFVQINYRTLEHTEVTQLPAMNTDQLVGYIGGQLGLFLGASILTVLECFELLVLMIRKLSRIVCSSNKVKDSDPI